MVVFGFSSTPYNPHFVLLRRLVQNTPIRTIQRTKNVPLNPPILIKRPQKIRPTTFAILRTIFNGADEALESIS